MLNENNQNLIKEMYNASMDKCFSDDLKKSMNFFESFDLESYISETEDDEW